MWVDCFYCVNVGVICKVLKIRTVRTMLANENIQILTRECFLVLNILSIRSPFGFTHTHTHTYIYICIYIKCIYADPQYSCTGLKK